MAHLISSFEKLLELRDGLESSLVQPASLGFKGEQCRLGRLSHDSHAYCLDEISDFLFDLASSLLHRRYLRGLFFLLGVDTIRDVSSHLVIGKDLKKHGKDNCLQDILLYLSCLARMSFGSVTFVIGVEVPGVARCRFLEILLSAERAVHLSGKIVFFLSLQLEVLVLSLGSLLLAEIEELLGNQRWHRIPVSCTLAF